MRASYAVTLLLAIGCANAFYVHGPVVGSIRPCAKWLPHKAATQSSLIRRPLESSAGMKMRLTSDTYVVLEEDKGTLTRQSKPETSQSQKTLREMLSGLVVAFASIPISISFANMAGLHPLVGIWSSVAMGLIAPLIGGCPGLISGAAGYVAISLAPMVAAHGSAFVMPTMLLVAMIEMLFSVMKLGRFVNIVSDSVLKGFMNGLGCLLIKFQISMFASLSGTALSSAIIVASGAGIVTAILPKLTKAVPSSLVAVVLSTVISKLARLNVQTLFDIGGKATFAGGLTVLPTFKGSSIFSVPQTIATAKIIVPVAACIASISILQTLLAGKVIKEFVEAEGDAADNNNDRMLAGLSLGTAFSGMMGGFGGCATIPLTILNLQSGGRSIYSSAAAAVAMAVLVLIAAPVMSIIPLASLAGVMLTVAFSSIQFRPTLKIIAAARDRRDVQGYTNLAALMTTSIVCFFVDIALGIFLGVMVTLVGSKIAESNTSRVQLNFTDSRIRYLIDHIPSPYALSNPSTKIFIRQILDSTLKNASSNVNQISKWALKTASSLSRNTNQISKKLALKTASSLSRNTNQVSKWALKTASSLTARPLRYSSAKIEQLPDASAKIEQLPDASAKATTVELNDSLSNSTTREVVQAEQLLVLAEQILVLLVLAEQILVRVQAEQQTWRTGAYDLPYMPPKTTGMQAKEQTVPVRTGAHDLPYYPPKTREGQADLPLTTQSWAGQAVEQAAPVKGGAHDLPYKPPMAVLQTEQQTAPMLVLQTEQQSAMTGGSHADLSDDTEQQAITTEGVYVLPHDSPWALSEQQAVRVRVGHDLPYIPPQK